MREPNLMGVWKSALDLLREAEEWIIVGYSFPDEDLGVRALITRAYGARDRRPHITVVQYNRSSFARYDAFFDPAELTFCIGGLSAFLEQWTVIRRFTLKLWNKNEMRTPAFSALSSRIAGRSSRERTS